MQFNIYVIIKVEPFLKNKNMHTYFIIIDQEPLMKKESKILLNYFVRRVDE